MDLKLRQLFGNSLYTVGRQGISVLLTFALSGLLARMLGTEGFGIYNLALLLPLLVTRFTNLGVRQALIYYIGRRDYPLSEIAGTSLIVVLGVSVVSGIIAYGLIFFAGPTIFPDVPVVYLHAAALAIPALLFIEFLQGAYIGLQDFKRYNLITILPDLALLIFLIGSAIFDQFNVLLALVLYVISRVIVLLYLFQLARQPSGIVWRINRPYFNAGIAYSFKTHIGNLLAFLNYRVDQFIVNFFLGPAQLGVYVAAVTLSEGISLLSGGVSTVLLPRVAELNKDPQRQVEITSLVSRHMLVISFLISVVLFFLSDFIVKVIYSADLEEAAIALQLLLPGIFITSVSRILATDIAGRGYPEFNTYGGLYALIINIVANLILIPKYGIAGAAISSSISYTVNGIYKFWIYQRLSGATLSKLLLIQPSDFGLYKKLFSRLFSSATLF
jgi:O-antigen/teichoic acid export membrane protein